MGQEFHPAIPITIAALPSMAAIAMVSMNHLFGSAAESKLVSDVANINSAIRVYKAHGGKISPSWKGDKILAELKTAADSTSGEKLAGSRGTLLDPRVETVLETFEEASRGTAKAIWDTASERFRVAYTTERGLKAFRLNEALAGSATETRERTANLKLATVDKWIWDYKDRSLPTTAPFSPDIPAAIAPPVSGGSGAALTLIAPEFSVPSKAYPLSDYDLSIYLTNPNPPGVSAIHYSITPGV